MFLFVAALATAAHAASPVDKVIGLLSDLVAKIEKEGQEAQKVFVEFDAWCVDRDRNIEFEIKTGKAEVATLSATIEKQAAKSSASRTKVEELAASIAKNEADLKAATEVRETEATDFASDQQETRDCISALERAIAILNREMTKGSASMMQIKGSNNIIQALNALVQGSSLSSADATRLTSLVQSSHESESSDEDETDPAVYKKDRGGIIGVLENLLDKAQEQLENGRTAETAKRHNFEMVKQSLNDEIAADNGDMAQSKKNIAASEEAKSIAEGDLAVTSADLKEDEDTFATLAQDCKTGRDDHAADSASRAEELHNLAFAKKILVDKNATYTAAVVHTYGDAALDQVTTFFQVSRSNLVSSADLVKFEAVRFVRDLAHKENSPALAQLAAKMSSIIRFGASSGSDPMAKVKQLLADMIATLEKAAKADATQKAFCDKEISESKVKNAENQAQLDKLSTRIDGMGAQTAQLKEQSATLQEQLGQLARAQAEMNKMRFDAKALFAKHKQEMQAGITGLQKAVTVLKEYYANDDSNRAEAGAGGHAAGQSGHNEGASRIISELQTVESDFSQALAEMESSEATAAREYEDTSHVNKISKATKETSLKHKAKEIAGLGKSLVEATSDKEGAQSEFDAVTEYLTKLGHMCVGKASTFADRKARRDAETSGLQEALAMLEGKPALIQRASKRSFRGKQSGVQHTKL